MQCQVIRYPVIRPVPLLKPHRGLSPFGFGCWGYKAALALIRIVVPRGPIHVGDVFSLDIALRRGLVPDEKWRKAGWIDGWKVPEFIQSDYLASIATAMSDEDTLRKVWREFGEGRLGPFPGRGRAVADALTRHPRMTRRTFKKVLFGDTDV